MNNRQRKTDDFRRAKAAIRLTRTALPDAAVHLLAEEEVTRLVTRLQPRTGQLELPQPADISMFCDALLSADIDAGAAIIRQARREGMDTETVYLGYIAGAAQHLGKLWEDDRVSFMNVSVAASRIFGIMRLLRYEIANARKLSPLTQHAMFACVPGEDHTLGVTVAADMFRARDWRVELCTGMDHDRLVQAAGQRPFSLIGLSAGNTDKALALARLIVALRITQPQAFIMVGGPIVEMMPELNDLIAADAVISNASEAMQLLDQLTDPATGE